MTEKSFPIKYICRGQIPLVGRESSITWWHWVVGIDLVLVLFSVLKNYLPDDYFRIFFLRTAFNLAAEMNLAVWWSGLTLGAIGILSYELFTLRNDETKGAWLAVSILFLGLSVDEVASLHERIGGWSNLLPYGLICLGLFIYSLNKLMRVSHTRKTAILIFIAFFLYGSVAFQEFLEHHINWPDWAIGLRLGIEEGTELLATLIAFFGIVPQRNLKSNSIGAVLPRPHLIYLLPRFVLVGLGIHVALIVIFPELMNTSKIGNVLTWYPMTLFFILSSTAYWMSLEFTNNSRFWSCLAVISVLCSAGIMYRLVKFFPVVRDVIPGRPISFLLYLLFVIFILFWTLKQGRDAFRKIILPLAMYLLLLFGSILYFAVAREMPLGHYLTVSGLYAYLLYALFEKIRANSLSGSATENSYDLPRET